MTLREALVYTPQELDFGTSGLRGLVTDMTDLECYINSQGFIFYLLKMGMVKEGDEILVGGDLRGSTPKITQAVIKAIQGCQMTYRYCGKLPTPALALSGLIEGKACIMVTGSHIPADRNGIKFYKIGGEVLKEDEAAIKETVAEARKNTYAQPYDTSVFDKNGKLNAPNQVDLGTPDQQATKVYKDRYTKVFGDKPLLGKQIVVYQHSAVGRDLLVELLETLGAEVVPYGRSDVFIPIDTENVTPSNKALFRKIAQEYPDNFAIVSTDGDSDRPFVIDNTGEFYRGDILGCITAELLKLDFVAIPISSNDAVDSFCETNGISVVHTKIGSPYVIVAMDAADLAQRPGGWEVNGGFLLGTDVSINGCSLRALPTRDAVLPILTALLSASHKKISVAELFAKLPQRFTGSGIVDNVPIEKLVTFRERVAIGEFTKQEIVDILQVDEGDITSVDTTDGLRLIFGNGQVVHFRPSGNAPQMRVYTNCDSQKLADEIVALAIAPDGYLSRILGLA